MRSTSWIAAAVVAAMALTTLAPRASAQTPPDDWGEDDDGFGDDDDGIDIDDSDLELDRVNPLSLTGFLRTDWGFWAERFGDDVPGKGRAPWARGRQSLDLVMTGKWDWFRFRVQGHAEYDLRYLGDQLEETDDFDQPTEDEYAWQILPREALVAFSFGPAELTLGRQIVAWGEGDALSVLDVVNPRDMREPGLADLDDIRLSVLATRLGVFVGAHRIELMVLHEADFGLRSPPFGPFSPFAAVVPPAFAGALGSKDIGFSDKQERFSLEAQQPLLRWVYNGPDYDAGLYAAWVLDLQGVFELDPAKLIPALADPNIDRVDIEMDHRRYGVLGATGAFAISEWLVKWELAYKINKSFNVGDASAAVPSIGVATADTLDVMGAISWTPFSDLNVALEFTKSTFLEEPEQLLFPSDLPTFALRARYQLLKERLVLAFGASMFGLTDADQIGVTVRAGADYEFFDGFEAGLGYIHFSPSKDLGFLSGLDTHDQLFLHARWDFTIL